MIAATATRISVEACELVFCLGWDDGDATFAAGAEGAAGGIVTTSAGGSCASAEVAATFGGCRMLGCGTLLVGTLLGGTMIAGAFSAGGGAGIGEA